MWELNLIVEETEFPDSQCLSSKSAAAAIT